MEWFHVTAAVLLLSSSSHILLCASADRLRVGESISGNQTIVSSGGVFVLGFFSPTNSTANLYAGIWYNHVTVKRYVWVANREEPVRNSPGVLRLSEDRNLVVEDSDGSLIWSSNSSSLSSSKNDTSAVLLDTGNLVLRQGEDNDLWQSFEHPTDTFLPGMSLSSNYRTKTADRVTCWRDKQDPSPGNFSLGIDANSSFQFLTKRGPERYWRSFVWIGRLFAPLAPANSNFVSYLTYNVDDEWANATYSTSETSALSIFVLTYTGQIELLEWKDSSKKWSVQYFEPAERCDSYGLCGPFGVCDSTITPSTCKCLEGFEPNNQKDWDNGDFQGGCARKKTLKCDASDEFVTINHMKLPDHSVFLSNVSISECKKRCFDNGSCTAYAYIDSNKIERFNACFIWSDGLVDLVRASGGNDLYVRLASSAMGKRKKTIIILIVVTVSSTILFAVFFYFVCKCKKMNRPNNKEEIVSGETKKHERRIDLPSSSDFGENVEQVGTDFPFFNFEVLMAVTDNFSDLKQIGQGGFGKVYKGKLPDGLEIAIKRLSSGSGQGLEEFKNEVMVIAKLQHRNLVRLLGCCIEGEEKILIYEYLPNKSLDSLLFSSEKRMLLDWKKRFNIIKGIAKGLLYLHEDSRLRIIHRDLKAGNILLDEDMNPKISDFGMARIFGGSQNQANTARVVGTYGYMSPEYAMKGIFSVKSDVYSYGILILEILSGRKNTSFHLSAFPNLISHAWQLWEDGKLAELVDSSMHASCLMDEVSRCIHVALLCVQDRASERLTMSSVVFMLENGSPLDCLPKRPTLTSEVNEDTPEQGVEIPQTSSVNNVTITKLQGR